MTSSVNLGIVTSDGAFRLTFMARSCVDSLVRNTNEQIYTLAGLLGFTVTLVDGYPGWKIRREFSFAGGFEEVCGGKIRSRTYY